MELAARQILALDYGAVIYDRKGRKWVLIECYGWVDEPWPAWTCEAEDLEWSTQFLEDAEEFNQEYGPFRSEKTERQHSAFCGANWRHAR